MCSYIEMFYDFDEVFTKELVWSEILKRSEVTDDGCRIWTARLHKQLGFPVFWICRSRNGVSRTIHFDPRRLSYQLTHENDTLEYGKNAVQMITRAITNFVSRPTTCR